MSGSGSRDPTIKIWDLFTGSLIRQLKGHVNDVLALCVLGDGKIVSGSRDKSIIIWKPNKHGDHVQSGSEKRTIFSERSTENIVN